MAELVRMPEVLAGATEAAIEKWLVAKGDSVAIGQTLAEIETDKATVELNAESAGTVGQLLAAEGTSVAVGDVILALLSAGESEEAVAAALAAVGIGSASPESDNAAPAQAAASASAAATVPASVPSAVPSTVPPTSPSANEPSVGGEISSSQNSRLFASPIVRKLASQNGVSLSGMTGTGPGGRIVRRDLERHLEAAPTATSAVNVVPSPAGAPTPAASAESAHYEDVPLGRMRSAIARRLTESKSTVPHFYLVADCRADALLELRKGVNNSAARKVSVNDFIIKAAAGAFAEVPAANAIWNGDSIRHFTSVDISVAVAIEGGLVTPVLRGVEALTLTQVSAAVADLADRGRSGGLKQHELEGGSFAVSNLGMYGTTEFSAILNPPQSGILAVGAARAMPVVDDNGELAVGTVMTVTLSADHRVLDGALAAEWLAAFQRRIEHPLSILV